MSKENSGLGKFVAGAAIGAGLGVLFEIMWQNLDENKKEETLKIIKNNL